MNRPSLHRLKRYAMTCLGLKRFFHDCGDGRSKPRKSAVTLLWALLAGQWLRHTSFFAIEQLVHLAGPKKLGLATGFGDDTLSYFTERLDPARTRQALIDVLHRAKRNKAFENGPWIGLAIDGTRALPKLRLRLVPSLSQCRKTNRRLPTSPGHD